MRGLFFRGRGGGEGLLGCGGFWVAVAIWLAPGTRFEVFVGGALVVLVLVGMWDRCNFFRGLRVVVVVVVFVLALWLL